MDDERNRREFYDSVNSNAKAMIEMIKNSKSCKDIKQPLIFDINTTLAIYNSFHSFRSEMGETKQLVKELHSKEMKRENGWDTFTKWVKYTLIGGAIVTVLGVVLVAIVNAFIRSALQAV